MIRLLNENTMTAWADSRERPYAQIKGRIKPRTKERTRYYCQTDHNKNVTGLADGNGTIRATWDYVAFGNCISQSGDKAEWTPVKYSSEYHDKELDLIYYNYRHYNPKDGRWISRDPLGEDGGWNLYCFLENYSLTLYDFRGMCVAGIVPGDAELQLGKYISELYEYECPQGARVRKTCSEIPHGYPIQGWDNTGFEYRTKIQRHNHKQAPNGCGSKNGTKAPDSFYFNSTTIDFTGPCNDHDICYGTCGNEKNTCDIIFYTSMMLVCLGVSNPSAKNKCTYLAATYFSAVSVLGKDPYEEAQDDACKWIKCPCKKIINL